MTPSPWSAVWRRLRGALPLARPDWTASAAGSQGVRAGLILFAATIVLLMWLSLYFRIEDERASITNAKLAELDNLAALLDEHIQRIVLDADIVLQQLDVDFRRQGARFDLARYASERGLTLHQYNIISILDERGDLRHSTVTSSATMNFARFDNFRHHRDQNTRSVFIDRPRAGLITGKPTIYLSRRINGSDGRFGGTLNVGLDANLFSAFFRHLSLGPQGFVLILARDGRTIVVERADGEKAATAEFPPATTVAALLSAKNGHLRTTGLDGHTPQLVSYRQLNDYPLVVAVGQSEDHALADSQSREAVYVRWRLIATLLMALAAGVLLLSLRRGERVREEIMNSESNLREAQRIAHVGSWERNLMNDQMSWSREMFNILGIDPRKERASHNTFTSIIHPEDRERVQQAYRHRHPHTIEYRLLLRNGVLKHVQESFNVVHDENLRASRMLGTLQDITERKLAEARLQQEHGMRRKAEQELFDARMLLAEAERMEIVGRLATGVAHEVKNPLAIIRLGIDYLSDHPPADDRSALVMADIRDSVGRADNVIKELLDFSRAKPLNRVAVRADSIVENAARLMRHELTRQNIEIVSRYDPSAGLILADSDRMVQVFINLLTNAAQAIGQDGRIEIVVRSLVVSEHELALLDRDFFALGDEAIVVEIADNGPGIPNENLGKLFEPFFTTKPLGAGTGIGLAVSRSIVTTHEAAISLVNRSKGGALATVTFRPYSAPRNWLNSCRRSSIDETAHPDRG